MPFELEEPMTNVAVDDAKADVRWRTWQAQGVQDDLRRGRIMGPLIILIFIALAANVVVQLAWRI
jgi:hypothetical protein